MGGDDKTRINHPVYEVKQGDPEFQEVWKKLPDETEAQKLVKKLSMGDQRKLMVEEGFFKYEDYNDPPEPYDQFKVTERAEKMITAMTLPPNQVRPLALKAMEKRLAREKQASLVAIAKPEC